MDARTARLRGSRGWSSSPSSLKTRACAQSPSSMETTPRTVWIVASQERARSFSAISIAVASSDRASLSSPLTNAARARPLAGQHLGLLIPCGGGQLHRPLCLLPASRIVQMPVVDLSSTEEGSPLEDRVTEALRDRQRAIERLPGPGIVAVRGSPRTRPGSRAADRDPASRARPWSEPVRCASGTSFGSKIGGSGCAATSTARSASRASSK